MSLLEINQTQAQILQHQDRLKKAINQSISTLKSQVAEINKFAAYLHEESKVGELVDNQDRNSFLGYVGRKSDAIADISADLITQKALKGANNTATATNMESHITAISYVHDDYKVNFESD